MDGVEAGVSGALLIVAQLPKALYIQNRCAAAVADWWYGIQHLNVPKANLYVAFHHGKDASFLSQKKAGAVFNFEGSHILRSQNSMASSYKSGMRIYCNNSKDQRILQHLPQYPGILHSWGICPLGCTWCYSKCCCLSSSLCWKSEDGRIRTNKTGMTNRTHLWVQFGTCHHFA